MKKLLCVLVMFIMLGCSSASIREEAVKEVLPESTILFHDNLGYNGDKDNYIVEKGGKIYFVCINVDIIRFVVEIRGIKVCK